MLRLAQWNKTTRWIFFGWTVQTCLLASLFVGVQGRDCSKICETTTDEERFDADLLQGEDLLERFQHEKDRLEDALIQDYGLDNYQNMFRIAVDSEDDDDDNYDDDDVAGNFSNITEIVIEASVSVGRLIFRSPNTYNPRKKDAEDMSWNRMKRKFLIKILEAQVAIQKEREKRDSCDCKGHGRYTQQSKEDPKTFYSDFFWVNGGHSVSAGHGNFYRESYTAVLERQVQPIFQGLGIDFVTKNYAMGGTPSGPEVALCMESIFGQDIDTLTWDYGMTDGLFVGNLLLYAYRAAQTRRRPAILGFFGTSLSRIQALLALEQQGLTAFVFDHDLYEHHVMNEIPDTQGLSKEEIRQMPPNVAHFKCGKQFEAGDPGCDANKYNNTFCKDRKFKARWHPGWKSHALQGNLMALFVIEVLSDAVNEAASILPDERIEKLQMLQDNEQEDYSNLLAADFPKETFSDAILLDQQNFDDVLDPLSIYRTPSFCHTALLPADIRYLGLLTETTQHVGLIEYDKGVGMNSVVTYETAPGISVDKENGNMRLSFNDVEHQSSPCVETLHVDYKDFFLVTSEEGWKTLTVPNKAEQAHYDVEMSNLVGLVMVCLSPCSWGKCSEDKDMHDTFGDHAKDSHTVEMKVNGSGVKSFTKVGQCYAVSGKKNGHMWKPMTTSSGQQHFEISVRIQSPDSYKYLRISSIIIA